MNNSVQKTQSNAEILFAFALGVLHKQEESHNLPVVFPTLTRRQAGCEERTS
jgi:hypothetical protein